MRTKANVNALYSRLQELGFSYEEAYELRRIEKALSRWAERECGDGSDWAIERDDNTGVPYNVYHGQGRPCRYRIADKERGALKRLARIMADHPDYVAYHPGDPRGCMLYIVRKTDLRGPIDSCYTNGLAVYA